MSTAIAQTIADQIGSRAFLMMGTQHKMADGNTLIFDIRGGRKEYNKIKITLTPLDVYTIEFIKFRNFEVVRTHTVDNVYTWWIASSNRTQHRTRFEFMNIHETENQTRLRRAKESLASCQSFENETRKSLAAAVESTKRAREKYESLFFAEEQAEVTRRTLSL